MKRRTFTDKEKLRAVELVLEGSSVRDISRFIGVSESVLYSWLAKHREAQRLATLNKQLDAPIDELIEVVEQLHAIVGQLVEQVRALRSCSGS